jgi:hypothetical protein
MIDLLTRFDIEFEGEKRIGDSLYSMDFNLTDTGQAIEVNSQIHTRLMRRSEGGKQRPSANCSSGIASPVCSFGMWSCSRRTVPGDQEDRGLHLSGRWEKMKAMRRSKRNRKGSTVKKSRSHAHRR